MLREVALFGGLAPALVPYFFAATLLFLTLDRTIAGRGVLRTVRHAPLARFGIFLCVLTAVVLSPGS